MLDQKKQPALALGFGLALTVSITLIKGGALAWVSLSWLSLCALALHILLVRSLRGADAGFSKLGKQTLSALLPIYLFIAFQLWALFQYIVISPDKTASLNQALIGLGMGLLLAIWSIAVRHPKALTLLYNAIVACAVIQSIYGLWIYLTGTDLLLWMPKLYYLDRPTGFFVNANHFAAYLLLGIILCISNIMASRPSTVQQNILTRTFEQLYNPRNAILCLLLITLLASKSSGAIVALIVVFILICLRTIWRSQQAQAKDLRNKTLRYMLLCAAGLILAVILLALSLDYATVEREAAGFAHTFSRRLEISKAAVSMLQSHWLIGIGGGAFYSQFSAYRTLDVGNAYYNYAHNDALQLWIEYGLIGLTLLLLFVGAVIRDNIRVLSKTTSGIRATFAYASIYSTIAVGVHSLVDFPLHIPGFSVCYLVLISINSLLLISQPQPRNANVNYQAIIY